MWGGVGGLGRRGRERRGGAEGREEGGRREEGGSKDEVEVSCTELGDGCKCNGQIRQRDQHATSLSATSWQCSHTIGIPTQECDRINCAAWAAVELSRFRGQNCAAFLERDADLAFSFLVRRREVQVDEGAEA